MLTEGVLARTGIDAVALKPTEVALSRAVRLAVDAVVDYEGRDALPDPDVLADLTSDRTVRVTTPIRADGFDPLGDDGLWDCALVGDGETVENRVERLREAGADTVVGYPARSLDALGR